MAIAAKTQVVMQVQAMEARRLSAIERANVAIDRLEAVFDRLEQAVDNEALRSKPA